MSSDRRISRRLLLGAAASAVVALTLSGCPSLGSTISEAMGNQASDRFTTIAIPAVKKKSTGAWWVRQPDGIYREYILKAI